MKNYTNENLIEVAPSGVQPGTLAIKIDDEIFVISTSENNGMNDIEFFDWTMILDK